MLYMGMITETAIKPTTRPTKMIRAGSINEVMVAIARSASSS